MSPPMLEAMPNNPYVGPRSFSREDADRFFGREVEGRDLVKLAVIEQVTILYGASGTGKSSLVNARLIPGLQQEGFRVLPVGRVSGKLPAGVDRVPNIFLFSLLSNLDQGAGSPAQLAHLSLSEFLEHLVTDDSHQWRYDPAAAIRPATEVTSSSEDAAPAFRLALIIDQFEEIITGHGERWGERAEFFRQLNQASSDHPGLGVVLVLRGDYIAALDPYAPLMVDRLRARFYLEHMGAEAALDAIRNPAELAGRPFAPGVAEKLAEDLLQVRVPGQDATVTGQYVEPVQLQVVCYQLWENIKDRPLRPITFDDLAEAGDVDRALTQLYEETLAAILAEPGTPVTEGLLRTWFDRELITAIGTRGLVRQGEETTGGLPNAVVGRLQKRFLVRAQARSGGTWIELVHDRFVEPIREANRAWFARNVNPLTIAAEAWQADGKPMAKLYSGLQLTDAARQMQATPQDFGDLEWQFVDAGQQVERRRTERRQRLVIAGVCAVVLLFAMLAVWGFRSSALATSARITAEASAKLAQAQLDRQAGLALIQEAYALKEKGDALGAIEKFRETKDTRTDLGINVENEIEDVRRQVATRLTQEGEALAKGGDFAAAEAKFKAALALEPPPDTPVYVYVPAGPFFMGEDAGSAFTDTLPAYWIQRTEVTNAQYGRCVKAGEAGEADGCKPPDDGNIRYRDPQFARQPVAGVTWFQAQAYAAWAGGRLPTEAEWEKACRGTDHRTYPWGNQDPTGELLNFAGTGLLTWSAVGSYPKGASPYGALDMAGNVWEWTSSAYADYPYDPGAGREGPDANSRVSRGGSFYIDASSVRCAVRFNVSANDSNGNFGFRVVVSPGF